MNYKKLLYSVMILGSVSTSVVSSGKVLADTVTTDSEQTTMVVSTEEAQKNLTPSTSTINSVEAGTNSQATSDSTPTQESTADVEKTETIAQQAAPKKQQAAIQQQNSSTVTSNAAITDGWGTDTSTPGIIKLISYTGTAKDVVIPTAKDFGQSGKTVTIDKATLTAAGLEADGQGGTLATSKNGDKIKVDGVDISEVFKGLGNIISIDLTNLDTSNVENMLGAFWSCTALTNLDVSGWDTMNTTTMRRLFQNCPQLTKLDVSSFNTSNVKDMYAMFAGDSSVMNLDVSSFNTSNVKDMYAMFWNCSALTNMDVSKFDTANVTTMGAMFMGCLGLTSLDASNWNTSNVKDMNGMFQNDITLAKINVSGWNTSNVMNMHAMFYGCPFTGIDLSSWDTTSVTDMIGMLGVGTTTPLLVYTKDTNLKGYNYTASNRVPLGITGKAKSGTEGRYKDGSIEKDAFDFTSCVTDQSPEELLKTKAADLQSTSPDYGFQQWQGDATYKTLAEKVNGTYTALWTQGDLAVKDSTIYEGDSWTAKDNFVSAEDKDSNPVDFSKITVSGTVDTKKAGTYTVTYTNGKISKDAKITVKANQTALTVKNSTLTVGNKWTAKDNFVSAKDKTGATVDFSKVTTTGTVNTAKAGTYKVTYTYGGLSKEATITVKAAPITQYTVTFKTSTGGSLTGSTSLKVNKGAKVASLPTVKTTSGYTFAGWYNASNKKVEPKTVVINGNTTFTAKFTKKATPVNKVAMHRLYNPNSGEHFYTKNGSEKNNLVKVGWKYEGIGWYAPDKGTPVYRLYNKNAGDHHYTTNVNEKNNLVKVGWKYEGVAWYSGGSKKVYRQYNPNAKAGAHNYTTNKAENDQLVKSGWKAEGIGWYAQ